MSLQEDVKMEDFLDRVAPPIMFCRRCYSYVYWEENCLCGSWSLIPTVESTLRTSARYRLDCWMEMYAACVASSDFFRCLIPPCKTLIYTSHFVSF